MHINPHQRNMNTEGVGGGGAILKGPGENTYIYCTKLGLTSKFDTPLLLLCIGCDFQDGLP